MLHQGGIALSPSDPNYRVWILEFLTLFFLLLVGLKKQNCWWALSLLRDQSVVGARSWGTPVEAAAYLHIAN
jgi:hypothetical protein